MSAHATRFIAYQFVQDDGPLVEWLEFLPDYLDHYETILAAGYEPEDPTVKVGVLTRAWYEHSKGCLLVSFGEPGEGERFALSFESVVLPEE